jgi:rhodanese-related sulfurtransferase
MEPTRITPQEVKRRVDRGERLVFVDSRSPEAWAEADEQIPGSIRIPPDESAQHLDKIPRGRLVVTYCT